jgi:hypothetical protein
MQPGALQKSGGKRMESLRLKCKVGSGQFTGEYAISSSQSDGSLFSLFVDDDLVDCDTGTGDGWLSVDPVSRKGDDVLVRLPVQSLEGGQFVTVKSAQLKPEFLSSRR